jgi:hypothetical protein
MNAKRIALTGSMVALMLAPLAAAGEPATNPAVEIIGEASGPPPPAVCEGKGCATVVSIQHQGKEWVPVASVDGPGTYVGAEEGITVGTATAPLIVGEAALDKDESIWTITVRLQNGVLETIPQNFPPLFKRGDWVFVEGNSIRFAE